MSRQLNDPFTQKAKQLGYYSRAVFKLEEIQQKTNLIDETSFVVDLGASPGAFSQFALSIAKKGKVVACDLLPIKSIANPNFNFVLGDFSEEQTYQKIIALLEGKKINVLLSDIAPNLSGLETVDCAKSMYLAELAYDFALQNLAENGAGVIKLFQGRGFNELIQLAKKDFNIAKTIKPKASRKESKEVYLYIGNKK